MFSVPFFVRFPTGSNFLLSITVHNGCWPLLLVVRLRRVVLVLSRERNVRVHTFLVPIQGTDCCVSISLPFVVICTESSGPVCVEFCVSYSWCQFIILLLNRLYLFSVQIYYESCTRL